MSAQTDAGMEILVAYAGGQAALTPQALDLEIRRVWSEMMSSEQGRGQISHALGVDPASLQDANKAPFIVEDDTSGFFGVELAVAVHWATVNIVVPVLIGLTKDEVKARLVQLWRQVIKPAIDGDEGGDKFGDERSTPSLGITMKSPEHVKLERLIPIAAQLAVALHLGSDDISPSDHALRLSLKTQAKALGSHRGDLQAAFKLYRSKVEAIVDGLSLSDEFASAIDTLKTGLAERSCQCCDPKNELPCCQDRPTNDRVHRGGNCIAPIKNLYQDIEADVAQLWRQIFGETQLPGLNLATKHLDIADKLAVHKDFSLTGKAQIVDSSYPTTWITVAFYDSAFDWETVHAAALFVVP
jgi:hypothetical protein